jgi:AcrR family transcriptional regulator
MGSASDPAAVPRAPAAGRRQAAQPASSRDKIVDAAIACIRRQGVEHTSISAVAVMAGVSRPTVYAHFDTREALISAAMEKADAAIAGQVVAAASRRSKTAADFVVEALIAARREFRAQPAFNPADWLRADPLAAEQTLSCRALAVARTILAPIAGYEPALGPQLDEIAETMVRWLLSLLMFDSDRTSTEARLRSYLRRAVVPALGIPASPQDMAAGDTA